MNTPATEGASPMTTYPPVVPRQRYTIQYPEMTVHAADCADLGKARNQAETRETIVAPSALEAIAVALGDAGDESSLAGMGYTADDFRVMPCARVAR